MQLFIPKVKAEYESTINRSRFIGSLFPANSPEQAREVINAVTKKYHDSSHNCWAYVVGLDGETSHSSDAGEPSGTAGKPILGVLHKNDITNGVIVVSRYFGGVKLGIRGLIEAYRETASNVVNSAKIVPLILKDKFTIVTSYKYWEILQFRFRVSEEEYLADNRVNFNDGKSSDEVIKVLNIEYAAEIEITVSAYRSLNLQTFLETEQQAGLLKYSFIESYY